MPPTRRNRFIASLTTAVVLLTALGPAQAHSLSPGNPAADAFLHALQGPGLLLTVAAVAAVAAVGGLRLHSTGRVQALRPVLALVVIVTGWALWAALA